MKRILPILICFTVFMMSARSVLASQNYIYLGEEISGVRLYLRTPTVEKTKKMYEIINRDTGEYVYCIEPGVTLKNGYMTAYQSLMQLDTALTDEDWVNLRIIAYLGYGYEDRLDIKWYAVTQFLIWEYILEDIGEIYFIDENNNKIDLYAQEIAELKYDIEHYRDLPSFLMNEELLEITLKVNEEITLIDENNVLASFNITNKNLNAQISANTLSFSSAVVGSFSLTLAKETNLTATPLVFYSAGNQMVMNRAAVDLTLGTIKFNVIAPTFTLIKTSSTETIFSLAEAVYGIYNLEGTLYQTVTTDADGRAYLAEIDVGSYYLQEIRAPYGYALSEEKIYFEVVSEDVIIEVKDDLIKKKIIIEKYTEEVDGTLNLEANATFSVYDAQTNEFITTFATDEEGQYTLFLEYGQYIISQDSGKDGYHLALDINLVVDDTLEDETTIIVKNPKIAGSLVIEKIASDSLLPLSGVTFGLYDEEKNLIAMYVTDELGQIIISDLAPGIYYIRELASAEGYQLLAGFMEVEIKDNVMSTLKVTNRLEIEIPATGTNELILTILFSSFCLILGMVLCNYDKKE